MAVITQDGLFYGDRLKRCSQMAQLYWPRFYIASNTCGRLELNYGKMLPTMLASLTKPPSETQVFAYLGEYQDCFLLFVYEVSGAIWGQWDTPEDMLQRFKKKADERTPAPPEAEFAAWKEKYQAFKAKNSAKSFDLRSLEIIKNPEKVSQRKAHGIGIGVGIGDGIGIGTTLSPTVTDKRYKDFIEDIQKYWIYANKNAVPFKISGADGRNLKQFLLENQEVTRSLFQKCLQNRKNSNGVIQSEAINRWILRILEFAHGPLDRFNKPETANGKGEGLRRTNAQSEAEYFATLGITDADSEFLQAGSEFGRPSDVAGTAEVLPPRGSEGGIAKAHGSSE